MSRSTPCLAKSLGGYTFRAFRYQARLEPDWSFCSSSSACRIAWTKSAALVVRLARTWLSLLSLG